VLELRAAGGQRLLGSVPLGGDGRVRLQGALSSAVLAQPLAAQQGGPVLLASLDSGGQHSHLAPLARLRHVWAGQCIQWSTPIFIQLLACQLDIGRPQLLQLSLFGPLAYFVFSADYYWGTMTSNVPPERWVEASRFCNVHSPARDLCPTFQGWVTPIYLDLDLGSTFDPELSGNLSGWGIGVSATYSLGYAMADFMTPDDELRDDRTLTGQESRR